MRQKRALLFAATMWAWPAIARAEPAPNQPNSAAATLVVTRGPGAEDCPSVEGFVERVSAISPGSRLSTSLQPHDATWVYLEITHDLGRYSAFLQTRGRQQGSRTLSDVSPSCASLTDAVAVTLALLLDPAALTARPQTLQDHRERRPARQRNPPNPPPSESRHAVSLGGGVSVGLLPRAAPWVSGGVDTALGKHLRIGVGGGLALAQRVRYLGGYTEIGLGWGYARACATARGGRSVVELSFCVSPMLGVLAGTGTRYDFSAQKRWLWAAISGGPEISAPLSAISFWWLSVAAIAPLTLRGFAITVDGESHDTFVVKRVAATASLGLGARF